MRSVFAVAVATLLVTMACGRSEPAPEQKTAAPTLPPMISDRLVMQEIVDPSARAIWDAIGETLLDTGTQPAPNKEAAWQSVRRGAITLAEAGNLLQLEGRPRDQDVWIRTAKALADAGAAALAAAEAKNLEKLTEVGDQIYLACEECHKTHLLPGAAPAPAAGGGAETK
ncbi:MAG: hypothetical protein AB7I50_22845 [Vicinamibacterales bacterium]